MESGQGVNILPLRERLTRRQSMDIEGTCLHEREPEKALLAKAREDSYYIRRPFDKHWFEYNSMADWY